MFLAELEYAKGQERKKRVLGLVERCAIGSKVTAPIVRRYQGAWAGAGPCLLLFPLSSGLSLPQPSEVRLGAILVGRGKGPVGEITAVEGMSQFIYPKVSKVFLPLLPRESKIK